MMTMPKVRVAGFSVSIDGYGAGPAQDLEHPLGENGLELHDWLFGTQTFGRSTVPAREQPGSTTTSRLVDSKTSALGFLGATCSGPCAGLGPTNCGVAGGARRRPITFRSSC